MARSFFVRLSCMFLVFLGVPAYYAVTHARGVSREVTAAEVFDAISANLQSLGGVQARLGVDCSDPVCSFTDGMIAFTPGFVNMLVDQGTLGESIWHDNVAFNLTTAGTPGSLGLRLDDFTCGARPDYCWIRQTGIPIIWQPFWYAIGEPPDFLSQLAQSAVVSADSELINGVTCYRVSLPLVRLWVELGHLHRVIRYELDYAEGQLGFSVDLSGWSDYGLGELPDTLFVQMFDFDTGEPDSWLHVLSEIVVGADLSAELFSVTVPVYASEATFQATQSPTD